MPSVESIHYFPFTGAQGINPESAQVTWSGLLNDRQFILYDSDLSSRSHATRISQKQYPKLAVVKTGFSSEAKGVELTLPTESNDEVEPSEFKTTVLPILGVDKEVLVEEFGDLTHCFDAGDTAAQLFADYLQHPSVRVARRSQAWNMAMRGQRPSGRAVAPFHIVTTASVNALQQRSEGRSFGADRFRPNLVIDAGETPFVEREWIGGVLQVGGVAIKIHRETKRCNVPGIDQTTGRNVKDVPKLYPGLAKTEDGKPLFGVYGYPILGIGTYIHQGNPVSIVSR